MESKKKTSSERMGVLEAGEDNAVGVGAGREEPLKMRCCVAEVLSRNLIVFTPKWCTTNYNYPVQSISQSLNQSPVKGNTVKTVHN